MQCGNDNGTYNDNFAFSLHNDSDNDMYLLCVMIMAMLIRNGSNPVQ